jgi:hypothetical protein
MSEHYCPAVSPDTTIPELVVNAFHQKKSEMFG